ncbi:EEF1A lysine methyltransferase 2 [Orussus abietinus]|uniref:EEF1A lysine methyltransferase 2 n=1 Tax=Orussus abietinus TaxID=222816 RepID=UPI000625E0B8|nr:EEF1A lysine methyltransferase 2 [Orussus abietinus]
MMTECTGELNPSVLGTQEYWEKTYSVEIDNFKSHGDVGEIWFGEDSALRIIRWVSSSPEILQTSDKIIDVGCGNGMMLVKLAEAGFTNLTGIDYSKKAIDLAREVTNDKGYPDIKLTVCDILSDRIRLESDFKIAHDKGTYDAVSLSPDNPKEKKERYIQSMYDLLGRDGLLVLTSCNWTKDELQQQFNSHFELSHVIPTPTFQFGGQTGNSITSLVFRRR